MDEATQQLWWGEFTVEEGAATHWRVGPLHLWVQRRVKEWRVVSWSEADHLMEGVTIQSDLGWLEPPPHATVTRFATSREETTVVLEPALADRSVVTRPELPIFAMAGDEVALFVGTPIWVRLLVGPERRLLCEIPASRPSDTWFGASTQEGELCYAARTSARLSLSEMRAKPSRAWTRVVVRNTGADNLRVERLNLPVQRLTLFAASGARLWTESVSMERGREGSLVRVQVLDHPPVEAGALVRLTPPRHPHERNVVVRAISALLG